MEKWLRDRFLLLSIIVLLIVLLWCFYINCKKYASVVENDIKAGSLHYLKWPNEHSTTKSVNVFIEDPVYGRRQIERLPNVGDGMITMPSCLGLCKIIVKDHDGHMLMTEKYIGRPTAAVKEVKVKLLNNTKDTKKLPYGRKFLPRDGASVVNHGIYAFILGGWNPLAFPQQTTNEVWKVLFGKKKNSVVHNCIKTHRISKKLTLCKIQDNLTEDSNVKNDILTNFHNAPGVFSLYGKIFRIGGDNIQGPFDKRIFVSTNGVDWKRKNINSPVDFGSSSISYKGNIYVYNPTIFRMPPIEYNMTERYPIFFLKLIEPEDYKNIIQNRGVKYGFYFVQSIKDKDSFVLYKVNYNSEEIQLVEHVTIPGLELQNIGELIPLYVLNLNKEQKAIIDCKLYNHTAYEREDKIEDPSAWVSYNEGETFNKISDIELLPFTKIIEFKDKLYAIGGTKYQGLNYSLQTIKVSEDAIKWQTLREPAIGHQIFHSVIGYKDRIWDIHGQTVFTSYSMDKIVPYDERYSSFLEMFIRELNIEGVRYFTAFHFKDSFDYSEYLRIALKALRADLINKDKYYEIIKLLLICSSQKLEAYNKKDSMLRDIISEINNWTEQQQIDFVYTTFYPNFYKNIIGYYNLRSMFYSDDGYNWYEHTTNAMPACHASTVFAEPRGEKIYILGGSCPSPSNDVYEVSVDLYK
jgi:hypothetical protein